MSNQYNLSNQFIAKCGGYRPAIKVIADIAARHFPNGDGENHYLFTKNKSLFISPQLYCQLFKDHVELNLNDEAVISERLVDVEICVPKLVDFVEKVYGVTLLYNEPYFYLDKSGFMIGSLWLGINQVLRYSYPPLLGWISEYQILSQMPGNYEDNLEIFVKANQ